jgi:hypothetical protein
MAQKYRNGQKVKIIEVRDQHGDLKYPQIQEYINEPGMIVRGFVHRMGRNERIEPYPSYEVRLDTGTLTRVPVPEGALVPLDE